MLENKLKEITCCLVEVVCQHIDNVLTFLAFRLPGPSDPLPFLVLTIDFIRDPMNEIPRLFQAHGVIARAL